MNLSVSIGQYVPRDSIIHQLDPRLKLVAAVMYMLLIFFLPHLMSILGAFLFLALSISLSQVPILYILRSLRVLWLIIFLSCLVHIFYTAEGTLVWQWGIIAIYDEGVRQAALLTVRIFLLVMATSLLTLTTKPLVLTNGIAYMMKPIKKIGFPVHEFALMITIALRFIPTLYQETEKIIKAQQARGANFYQGNIFIRMQQFIAILIPLCVSSFQRADQLALAMEARAYRGEEGRTELHQLRFQRKDAVAAIIISIWFLLLILVRGWA